VNVSAWTVQSGEQDALAAFLRRKLPDRSWGDVKKMLATGKVRVGGEPEENAGRRLVPGDTVEIDVHARRRSARGEVTIVHDDTHVVVIDKPAGIMSVPFERGDRGTAIDLVREAWRRQGVRPAPLFVVHRIDKDTSGLLMFARTRRAEAALQALLRAHDVDRTYLCIAQGDVREQVIESDFVPDRGDGLRGSSDRGGKRAVTRVRPLLRLSGCTSCEVRLETGRTHQIRIHLAEAGHPLVGETVYIRDWLRGGGVPLPSPRLLLHAATLGFVHPVTNERLVFSSPVPPDFGSAASAFGWRR